MKLLMIEKNQILKYYSPAPPGIPHYLTHADLSAKEIYNLLTLAIQHKYNVKYLNKSSGAPLAGKTLAVMFSKRSTRTRVATESAVAYLGGQPMFLGSQDIQLGVNESLLDTAKVVSSMVDAHQTHPSKTLPGLRVAWVGDGNNILHSMMATFPKLGVHLNVATPRGYEPDEEIVRYAQTEAGKTNTDLNFSFDPKDAIKNADVIVTDTWISMGQEEEKAQRIKDFAGYRVTSQMAKEGGAKSDWKFLHCLPRKQEEVSDEIFCIPRSRKSQMDYFSRY
ncbi:1019_t:CDS:2 [Rhizophagus irregularis]|nr:1019_t:CDS:2 [Rhizophagus irregularis]